MFGLKRGLIAEMFSVVESLWGFAYLTLSCYLAFEGCVKRIKRRPWALCFCSSRSLLFTTSIYYFLPISILSSVKHLSLESRRSRLSASQIRSSSRTSLISYLVVVVQVVDYLQVSASVSTYIVVGVVFAPSISVLAPSISAFEPRISSVDISASTLGFRTNPVTHPDNNKIDDVLWDIRR
jgi:hypothetical protein